MNDSSDSRKPNTSSRRDISSISQEEKARAIEERLGSPTGAQSQLNVREARLYGELDVIEQLFASGAMDSDAYAQSRGLKQRQLDVNGQRSFDIRLSRLESARHQLRGTSSAITSTASIRRSVNALMDEDVGGYNVAGYRMAMSGDASLSERISALQTGQTGAISRASQLGSNISRWQEKQLELSIDPSDRAKKEYESYGRMIQRAQGVRAGYLEKAAQAEAGLGFLGQDQKSALNVQQNALAAVAERAIISGVASGPYGKMSSSSITTQITKEQENLGRLYKGESPLEGFSKNIDEATKKLQELSTALGVQEKAERGRAQKFATAGRGLQEIGQLVQTIGLDLPNQETGNRVRAAAMSNQMYDMRKAALSGDMTALTLLSSDVFEQAGAAGTKNNYIKRGSQVLLGAGAALGAAAAYTTVATGGLGVVPATGAALAGGGAAAIGLGADALMGVSGRSEEINERQRQIELAKQLTHVSGAQRQAAYNFARGNYNTAQSIGGGRGAAFLAQTSGAGADKLLAQMSEMGLGTQEFNELSGQLAASTGRASTNDILAAKGLSAVGFGTAQEHVSRMATVSQAGANNPRESYIAVLEQAFSKGLENSKVLDMIAQSTSQTAQASMGYQVSGLDVTGAAAARLTSIVGKDSINQVSDVARAMSTQEKINQIATDTSNSFVGYVNVARIQKATGLSYEQGLIAAQKDEATFGTIATSVRKAQTGTQAEQEEAATLLRKQGLSGMIDKDGKIRYEAFAQLEQAKIVQKLSLGGMGIATSLTSSKEFQDFVKKVQSGNDPNELLKQKNFAGLSDQMDTTFNLLGINRDQYLRGIRYGNADTNTLDPNVQSALDKVKKGETPDLSKLTPEQQTQFKLASAAGKEQTDEARRASEALGGFTNLMTAFTTATEALQKKGSESSGKFAEAAAKAATDFSQSTAVFTGGLSTLGEALVDMSKQIKSGEWKGIKPAADLDKKQGQKNP